MSGYPKLLWSPLGAEVTVHSASEQAEREADGYRETLETPAAPLSSVLDDPSAAPQADPFDVEPTFGGPGDDTHAKWTRKKK